MPPQNDPGWNWLTMLLPHLDQTPLYRQLNFNQAVRAPVNADKVRRQLVLANCPSDREIGVFTVLRQDGSTLADANTTSYVAVFGKYGLINVDPDRGNGVFQRNSRIRLSSLWSE